MISLVTRVQLPAWFVVVVTTVFFSCAPRVHDGRVTPPAEDRTVEAQAASTVGTTGEAPSTTGTNGGILSTSETNDDGDLARVDDVGGAVGSAPEADEPPTGAKPLDAAVARGIEVYKQNYCGMCHTLDLAGTGGIFGPTHDGMGMVAKERLGESGYKGAAASAGEYLRESIVEPAAFIVPGYEHTRYHMPAYTNLSGDDVDALVEMLLSATAISDDSAAREGSPPSNR